MSGATPAATRSGRGEPAGVVVTGWPSTETSTVTGEAPVAGSYAQPVPPVALATSSHPIGAEAAAGGGIAPATTTVFPEPESEALLPLVATQLASIRCEP